jgi:hypothetical protein
VYGHCVVPALCRRCRLRVRKRETRDVEDGRDFKGELARARAGRIRIMIGTRMSFRLVWQLPQLEGWLAVEYDHDAVQ